MFNILSYLILIFPVASIIYYIFTIYATQDFFSQKQVINDDFTPPVSILKPLCGIETNSYENLVSFVKQNYPQYQIIFCVKDSQDPIIKIVEQLINDFPEKDLSLVINNEIIGYNLKVSNLANGLALTKYETLILADSDIKVEPNYLQQIVQPLQDEKVGIVTCLYKSLGTGWIANIEGIGITCDFFPSVLTAQKLSQIKFAFGSTIVIRKKVLQAIGNFQAIANHLADDFLLGNLTAKLGYRVVLSNYIVEHQIGQESWQNFWLRQIRWLKCIKTERFWSYLGLIFTQGTVTSILFLIINQGSKLSILLCLITLILRLLMAYFVSFKHIEDPIAKNFLGLVFISDFLKFILWLWALFGNTIYWRSQKFKLINGSQLYSITN